MLESPVSRIRDTEEHRLQGHFDVSFTFNFSTFNIGFDEQVEI